MFRRALAPSRWLRRRSSTNVPQQEIPDGGYEDFRPPWVYTMSRLMSYTLIPSAAFYAIFFYDFGDREHVFQPARRWALRQKASFLSLSPEEEELLKGTRPQLESVKALSPVETPQKKT